MSDPRVQRFVREAKSTLVDIKHMLEEIAARDADGQRVPSMIELDHVSEEIDDLAANLEMLIEEQA